MGLFLAVSRPKQSFVISRAGMMAREAAMSLPV
eukprot:COSAG01_NODE_53825_length_336_cov_1.000000_1_plen_32_part_10